MFTVDTSQPPIPPPNISTRLGVFGLVRVQTKESKQEQEDYIQYLSEYNSIHLRAIVTANLNSPELIKK